MLLRKDLYWWDWSWTPVSGCQPPLNSPGCGNCWVLKWLNSHTWKTETVYSGAVSAKANKKGRRKWTGVPTTSPDDDPTWTLPLTHPGVINPALGPGQPNLIFCVMDGELFVTGRLKEDIDRVCLTIAVSRHIGLLCTKYTREMANYFAGLDPRTVRTWRPKLWLGFSAENQACFDRRWPDLCPFTHSGWFVFVSIAPMLGPVTLPPDFLALG